MLSRVGTAILASITLAGCANGGLAPERTEADIARQAESVAGFATTGKPELDAWVLQQRASRGGGPNG
ncbi:MAG: hypothetical protein AAGD13_13865 [Pseudomonadota bacterium]